MSQVTKNALAASLKKQLEKKTLAKITVTDIAEDSGVSRHTFYYYFRDIFDLTEWTYQNELEEALQLSEPGEGGEQSFLQILRYIRENRVQVLNTYRGENTERVFNYLFRTVHGVLEALIREKARGIPIGEEDRQFIACFYECAITGLIMRWIAGGMKEEAEQVSERLSRLLQGTFLTAIETFRRGEN